MIRHRRKQKKLHNGAWLMAKIWKKIANDAKCCCLTIIILLKISTKKKLVVFSGLRQAASDGHGLNGEPGAYKMGGQIWVAFTDGFFMFSNGYILWI